MLFIGHRLPSVWSDTRESNHKQIPVVCATMHSSYLLYYQKVNSYLMSSSAILCSSLHSTFVLFARVSCGIFFRQLRLCACVFSSFIQFFFWPLFGVRVLCILFFAPLPQMSSAHRKTSKHTMGYSNNAHRNKEAAIEK